MEAKVATSNRILLVIWCLLIITSVLVHISKGKAISGESQADVFKRSGEDTDTETDLCHKMSEACIVDSTPCCRGLYCDEEITNHPVCTIKLESAPYRMTNASTSRFITKGMRKMKTL